jgi:hypothetical protein
MAHQIITDSPIPRFTDSPFPQLPASPLIHHLKTASLQIKIVVIFLVLFGFFTTLGHASSLKGPWEHHESTHAVKNFTADHGFNPLWTAVALYRAYLSPIDGRNCPMYPSCSQYSLQCLQKHGPFIGWLMTCDRLFRCGRDEMWLCPETVVNGELRCHDPLENNDFWWWNGQ